LGLIYVRALNSHTLYVSDLDGTLLPSSGHLTTQDTSRLTDLVRARTLTLTYATARSHLMARRAVGHGWGTPAVVYNGAFTVDPMNGRRLRSHFIDDLVLAQTLHACHASDLAPIVFSRRNTRAEPRENGSHQGDQTVGETVTWLEGFETPGLRRYLRDRPGDPRFLPRQTWAEMQRSHTFYLSVIGEEAAIASLADTLGTLIGEHCTLNVQRDTYHSQDHWLEVTPPGVTKATEVRRLAKELGADRIVCFGDNNNDLSLFEVADESYAVANATHVLKAAATYVIGSNDERGVLRWLEENAT
jgi:Cof subfamily protein (haloacid dehalogenase superfamily)